MSSSMSSGMSSGMSSSDIFVGPMLDTDEYLEEYSKRLDVLEEEGVLPRQDVNLTYQVYSIQGGFGGHRSIVLTADDENFVTVELGFITVDGGKKHIFPVTNQLPKSMKSKMSYHGKIEAKGAYLTGKAVAVMKQFGSYFKLSNNCQHFCNKYLGAIGLPKEAQKLTDDEKVRSAASIASTVAVGTMLVGLFALSQK